MTVRQLVAAMGSSPWILAGLLAVPFAAALVMGFIHPKGEGKAAPWKYLYSACVYGACVPGMFSAVLVLYGLFFIRQNLLDADFGVYFLPLIAMAATLWAVRRSVSFDDVPGFDRLSGLMGLLGLTFATLLFIQKTRIWIVFGGSIEKLIPLGIGLFLLFKWSAGKAFGPPKGPDKASPPLP